MTEINPELSILPTIPENNAVVAHSAQLALLDEKVQCPCGKSVLKKNLASHQKTAAHLKATTSAETLPAVIDDNTNEPVVVKKDQALRLAESIVAPQLKIKQEFQNLHSKLDLMLEILADLHSAEYCSEDEETADQN